MTTEINWTPLVIAIELFAAFVFICFLAAVSDIWAKGSRKTKRQPQPVVTLNGEKVYLN